MGYRNPVITLPFNHLVEEGDTCHVIIRNPQTMPGDQFAAVVSGGTEASDSDKMTRMYQMLAGLIIGWRVWDPSVPIKVNEDTGELIHDEETQPRLLPLPATAENVGKLPPQIQKALMDKVGEAINPPANQAETTGSPS